MTKLEDMDYVINPNTGKKIDMKKLLTEQRLASIYIDTNFPFFSSLLRNLIFIYTFQVPTQATDGVRLLVNPEFTSKLSIKEKAFVMMHEVMHCALDHMQRGMKHDRKKSNYAADFEVNSLLVQDEVISQPDIKKMHALYDPKYDGMSYEHIYSIVPSPSDNPETQKGGGQGDSQDGEAGNSGEGGNSESGQSQDSGGGSGNKKHSPDFIAGWNKALEDYKNGKIKL